MEQPDKSWIRVDFVPYDELREELDMLGEVVRQPVSDELARRDYFVQDQAAYKTLLKSPPSPARRLSFAMTRRSAQWPTRRLSAIQRRCDSG
jgi:hypothetical protein